MSKSEVTANQGRFLVLLGFALGRHLDVDPASRRYQFTAHQRDAVPLSARPWNDYLTLLVHLERGGARGQNRFLAGLAFQLLDQVIVPALGEPGMGIDQ